MAQWLTVGGHREAGQKKESAVTAPRWQDRTDETTTKQQR